MCILLLIADRVFVWTKYFAIFGVTSLITKSVSCYNHHPRKNCLLTRLVDINLVLSPVNLLPANLFTLCEILTRNSGPEYDLTRKSSNFRKLWLYYAKIILGQIKSLWTLAGLWKSGEKRACPNIGLNFLLFSVFGFWISQRVVIKGALRNVIFGQSSLTRNKHKWKMFHTQTLKVNTH